MQAKQEKWDLYDQQGRKTGKTIQAGETVPYGYVLAYGSLTVKRRFF